MTFDEDLLDQLADLSGKILARQAGEHGIRPAAGRSTGPSGAVDRRAAAARGARRRRPRGGGGRRCALRLWWPALRHAAKWKGRDLPLAPGGAPAEDRRLHGLNSRARQLLSSALLPFVTTTPWLAAQGLAPLASWPRRRTAGPRRRPARRLGIVGQVAGDLLVEPPRIRPAAFRPCRRGAGGSRPPEAGVGSVLASQDLDAQDIAQMRPGRDRSPDRGRRRGDSSGCSIAMARGIRAR